MESPLRRSLLLLRQHPWLLSGPWLGVCAFGSVVAEVVQPATNRLLPVLDLRALRNSGHGDIKAAWAESMRASYIRLAAVECVQILEYAAKVVVLAMTVLLVVQITKYGRDTFSGAIKRLRRVPAAIRTLLKLFLLVLVIGFGATLVATAPPVLYIPWQISMHGVHHPAPHFPRWAFDLSTGVGRLLFVLCVMPFFLHFVVHFVQQPSSGEDAPKGQLVRALGYGAAAVVMEALLRQLMRPVQMQLVGTLAVGDLIQQRAIALAANLITSLPTIVCVIVLVLLVMGAEKPIEVDAA
jgi:hypothetical protein